MQFPKLTPLQSRFAASLVATLILAVVYFTLSPYHFAYAAELDSVFSEDHVKSWLPEGLALAQSAGEGSLQLENEDGLLYEPDFVGIDTGIIRRADDGTTSLSNNVANNLNLDADSTNFYTFTNTSVFGTRAVNPRDVLPGDARPFFNEHILEEEGLESHDLSLQKRQSDQDSRTVYISVNVCTQPSGNRTTSAIPPQLTLYVSTSVDNRKPGPDTADKSKVIVLHEGFANYTVNATGDVFMGVHAPALASDFSGQWNYDIAASIDAPYHMYNETMFLNWVDSDTNSALFVTNSMTGLDASDDEVQKLMEAGAPYTMFAVPRDSYEVKGIQNSYCGMSRIFNQSNLTVETGMTTRGVHSRPKGQFVVQGLQASSSYYGMLAMKGNSTHEAKDVAGANIIGGGGQVWRALNFTTKADGNCQLIYNLPFCSEVAYAVPSNPDKFNASSLAQLYDNSTSSMYQNFNFSLQQIPCNTTSTAQYSLARNCTSCANDYKNWLCAVTIPRCEDFSSTKTYLQPRSLGQTFINGSTPDLTNATMRHKAYANNSRNPLIDEQINPGPYKELLPCEDLCYSLVQSCPAQLGFACPLRGRGLEFSYGQRSDDGSTTCNYLGALNYENSGDRWLAKPTMAAAAAAVVWIVTTFVC